MNYQSILMPKVQSWYLGTIFMLSVLQKIGGNKGYVNIAQYCELFKAIKGYTMLHKAMQGYSYKRQIRLFIVKYHLLYLRPRPLDTPFEGYRLHTANR